MTLMLPSGCRVLAVSLGLTTACPARAAGQVIKKPKTAAGVRTVALPRWLMPELIRYFDIYAESGPEGRVFIEPKGATPLRPNFSSVCGADDGNRTRAISLGS